MTNLVGLGAAFAIGMTSLAGIVTIVNENVVGTSNQTVVLSTDAATSTFSNAVSIATTP